MTAAEVRCATCSQVSKIQIYSAGLSDVVEFTCDRDATVLTVSTYDTKLTSILGAYPVHGCSENHIHAVEENLVTCPCGGSFKHDAKPKCPNCREILRVEKLGHSEFVVVGRLIDGDKDPIWR